MACYSRSLKHKELERYFGLVRGGRESARSYREGLRQTLRAHHLSVTVEASGISWLHIFVDFPFLDEHVEVLVKLVIKRLFKIRLQSRYSNINGFSSDVHEASGFAGLLQNLDLPPL